MALRPAPIQVRRRAGTALASRCESGCARVVLAITHGRHWLVQVNYLVYPGTSGATFLDYVVVDRVAVPPEHARTSCLCHHACNGNVHAERRDGRQGLGC